MTDEPNKPIVPPETRHPDDRLRVPLEAAPGVIPGVSGLVKLVGEFVPTQAQKSRSKWEGAVSARTNEHADRLDDHDQALNATTTLTGVSVQLAVALAHAPSDGMAGRGRMLPELCALLPDAARCSCGQELFAQKSRSDRGPLSSALVYSLAQPGKPFGAQPDPQESGGGSALDSRDGSPRLRFAPELAAATLEMPD
jgi:hypothetical protein